MKNILITLVCACLGLTALSASSPVGSVMTEQLQVMPLTGYVRLGDVDADGWVPVEYVGTENVTMTAAVNGSNVSIINHRIKLPSYGTHVVVVTVKATGYATLSVTFDDVTWEQDPHNEGYWIVFINKFGEEIWHPLLYTNGDHYVNVIDLYPSIYDDLYVRFHYVINGVIYGPPGDDDLYYLLEYYIDYPLVESSFNYYIEAGYSYWFEARLIYNEDLEIDGYNAIVIRYALLPSDILGDVNGDFWVGIGDVTALIDYLLTGNAGIIIGNADINGDGKVDIADVTSLIDELLY